MRRINELMANPPTGLPDLKCQYVLVRRCSTIATIRRSCNLHAEIASASGAASRRDAQSGTRSEGTKRRQMWGKSHCARYLPLVTLPAPLPGLPGRGIGETLGDSLPESGVAEAQDRERSREAGSAPSGEVVIARLLPIGPALQPEIVTHILHRATYLLHRELQLIRCTTEILRPITHLRALVCVDAVSLNQLNHSMGKDGFSAPS